MRTSCVHETEVIRSSSSLSAELADHARACEICSLALEIDEAMKRFSGSVPRTTLPPPALIWLKAQLLGVGGEVEAVNRPLSIAEKSAWVVTGAAWIALALSHWPRVKAWIGSIELDHVAKGTLASFPLTPTLMGAFVFLIAITFTLMMQTAIQHE